MKYAALLAKLYLKLHDKRHTRSMLVPIAEKMAMSSDFLQAYLKTNCLRDLSLGIVLLALTGSSAAIACIAGDINLAEACGVTLASAFVPNAVGSLSLKIQESVPTGTAPKRTRRDSTSSSVDSEL